MVTGLRFCSLRVHPHGYRTSSPPVPDLIDARHGQAGRFGESLAGDTALKALAD
jgi:hypothetical protein